MVTKLLIYPFIAIRLHLSFCNNHILFLSIHMVLISEKKISFFFLLLSFFFFFLFSFFFLSFFFFFLFFFLFSFFFLSFFFLFLSFSFFFFLFLSFFFLFLSFFFFFFLFLFFLSFFLSFLSFSFFFLFFSFFLFFFLFLFLFSFFFLSFFFLFLFFFFLFLFFFFSFSFFLSFSFFFLSFFFFFFLFSFFFFLFSFFFSFFLFFFFFLFFLSFSFFFFFFLSFFFLHYSFLMYFRLNVLVDTGSSNFAIAAAPNNLITVYFHRKLSSTYESQDITVEVPYTQGKWKGILGSDMVTLNGASNITVRANLACITESSNFFINGSNWQGILGLAYADIARPDSSVQPYFDTVVQDTGIPNMFSMQLCGTNSLSAPEDNFETGGTLVLGNIDETMYQEPIYYTPIQRTSYYEVLITDIQINGTSLGLDCKEYNFDKTIVDSGTTNLRLPYTVFQAVVDKLKQAVWVVNQRPPNMFWKGEDMLCRKNSDVPFNSFPTITIAMATGNNSEFHLVIPPHQYLRAVGDASTSTNNGDCFKFAIAGSDSGTVIGAVIMEGYYIIFDRANKSIGFAETTCQVQNSQTIKSKIQGPFVSKVNTSTCLFKTMEPNDTSLLNVAYILAGICGLCAIPLIADQELELLTPYGQAEKDKGIQIQEMSIVNTFTVHLDVPFKFTGRIYDTINLTKNGVITLGGVHPEDPQKASWENIPQALPLTTAYPLIAAYWTNPQITEHGDLWFQQTMDKKKLEGIKRKVQCLYPQNKDLVAKWAFIATWENITSSTDLLTVTNTFQIVLVNIEDYSYVLFQYGNLTWTSWKMPDNKTDENKIQSAVAGYNGGDGTLCSQRPGSNASVGCPLVPSSRNYTWSSAGLVLLEMETQAEVVIMRTLILRPQTPKDENLEAQNQVKTSSFCQRKCHL
ncbi:BACE1 [Acanthosepion pharaonis]|uniref:BACE1 n=1 Tax=Acanthosepion pharaonis TaxID=158019 RepID=A0A812BSW0_ACAPH|nr:BACE1 [Sepia pharaonis]